MPSYSELILDRRWKSKRDKILKRDNYLCANCGDDWLSEHEVVYISESVLTAYKNGWWARGYAKNPLRSGIPCFLLYNWDRDSALYTKRKSRFIFALKVIPKETASRLNIESILFDREVLKYNELEEFMKHEPYTIVYSLHVHHQYYIRERLPWEYNEDALITLCWSCHEKLHQNGQVPVLDERLHQISELHYCYRCHGAGWFPEFNHVQEGICFRCWGAKYEELIIPISS